MKTIYKVSQNYFKGVKLIDVDSVDKKNSTYTYTNRYGRVVTKNLIPIKGLNQPTFFFTKKEADLFLLNMCIKKILEYKTNLKKYTDFIVTI